MLQRLLPTGLILLLMLPTLSAQERSDYFVFLTTGKSTQGVAKEEIQKKQAAHLENFGRQAKLGNLTAAGPCSDPSKVTRGIVVVHANTIAEAEKLFEQDPYVTEGFMIAEMHQYRTIFGQLKLDLESNALGTYVIAIAKRGKKWPSENGQSTSVSAKLERELKANLADKNLGFAALFSDQSNNKSSRVAVMIFKTQDIESVKKSVGSISLFAEELLEFDAFPQYLAKNAL